jgi:ferredoxin
LIAIHLERCDGCGACVEVCPESALYLVDGKAAVDVQLCSECETCVAICPVEAITLTSQVVEAGGEPVCAPVPRPEREVIRVKTDSAPVPSRGRVLPVAGAVLSWAGREIVPRLVYYLLDGLDRRATQQSTTRVARSGSPSSGPGGSGRQRRHRHRGGQGGAG